MIEIVFAIIKGLMIGLIIGFCFFKNEEDDIYG